MWQNHFLTALAEQGMVFEYKAGFYHTVSFIAYNLTINLVSLDNNFSPDVLIELQEASINQGKKLIHLWEDVWISKSEQVLFRLKSLLNKNERIHGRKTKIRKITKPEADVFLNENHLQGSVTARYKFGLFISEELVAVATFSALRRMNYTEDYKSIELIRFAVKGGFSITGGLSKLINNLKEQLSPNDMMTYADRDWSGGEAYLKLGFDKVDVLNPQYFLLDNNLNRKIDRTCLKNNAVHVYNTGSLKFILKF
ncbi:hypothetical protein [Pedobacter rhodius]|uniref:Uncharacterized protein n=1 Tax=Pedobacter rhodius TaxID=3004098 RepID=A0ABT4KUS1_9SPHI|nr:hypothetical protein [Pedobacter sp. SJ11]MCZ4222663.1 hypothetical protein [Pedobacter sp. SJ11]